MTRAAGPARRFGTHSFASTLLSAMRDRLCRRVLLACIGFWLILSVVAQVPNQGNTRPKPKVKVSTEVVNVYDVAVVDVYAVVEDRKGRSINNLTKEDFIITE